MIWEFIIAIILGTILMAVFAVKPRIRRPVELPEPYEKKQGGNSNPSSVSSQSVSGDRLAYYANKRKEEQLKEKERDITLDSRELDLKKVEVSQHFTNLSYEHRERGLALGLKEMDLREHGLALSKQEITLHARKLSQDLQDRKLELKKQIIQQQAVENSQRLEKKAIGLQKQLLGFQSMQIEFQKKKASFEIGTKAKSEMMAVEKSKLLLLQSSVKQMYQTKSEWLRIQSRQNGLDHSAKQQQLKSLFQDTNSKIRALRLTRWENNLNWSQKETDRKWGIMKFVEENWLHSDYHLLEKTRKAGYTPPSKIQLQARYLAEEMERRGLQKDE